MAGRRVATLATCNLDQWAMDFEGNLARIRRSVDDARAAGATYRVGPELEVTGYGCEDHFLELDTTAHAWEAIAELVRSGHTDGLLVDVGAPAVHRGVAYNCRVLLLDRRVLLVRPKLHLANDGNYRETRYFATWKHRGTLEDFPLPPPLADLTGQRAAPFGDGALRLRDALLAAETCEELFTPRAPHIDLALAGVEVISNGSGSHHQLRKLDARLELITSATAKAGGVYLYANQRGCDGGRLYYDGCACVAVNGRLVAQGAQFGLAEVEVVTAAVDLDAVVSYRLAVSSLREQASCQPPPALVDVDFALCRGGAVASPPIAPRYHCPEEEIALGPAAWLWDYLRRSGASGFLLPLSGGADSSAVAAIVGSMCRLVAAAVAAGDAAVEADARRVGRYSEGEAVAPSPEELAGRLLTTLYMGSANSTAATRDRAAALAAQIGAHHVALRIDAVTAALVALFTAVAGKSPRFRADGGSNAENLALQNIQARSRMVIAFLFAQLGLWARGRGGWQLVLGSANVDEALRGYLTKYDCSAADVNPIGGVSKGDLKRFLKWGAAHLGYAALADVEAAPPTAELEPIREGVPPQTDEADMGMTYDELGLYGRLRKAARCGPVAAYRACLDAWRGAGLAPTAVAGKVKHFFACYAANRHKATVLPPAYHAEAYSPDDNRFDHRPFLYNAAWPWQFARIDALAAAAEAEAEAAKTAVTAAAGGAAARAAAS